MNSLCITPLTVISAYEEDIETQCAQAISPFPRIRPRVKNVCMLFLRITAVESLHIRGLQNSSARTCESNKWVFSNLESRCCHNIGRNDTRARVSSELKINYNFTSFV